MKLRGTTEIHFNEKATRLEDASRGKTYFGLTTPFSETVETNIPRNFHQLIDKHFPEKNNLWKIFNRKKVKVSYGCMPNMGAINSAPNKKILEDSKLLKRGPFNCCRGKRDN